MGKICFSDLLLATKDGEWGQDHPRGDLEPMLVIRGTDFQNVRFRDISNVPRRFIPRHIAERKALKCGDILIETAGGTKDQPTGRTVLLNDEVFEHSVSRVTCASFSRFLRADRNLVQPAYLFWYLQSIYNSGVMYPFHVQHTGVARFQYTQFATSHKVPLPSMADQLAISSVLSAFDDRISLNRRLNDTLETTARAIFKDWFVDFGPTRAKMEGHTPYLMPEVWALFPDHLDEHGIPKGWTSRRVEDLCELAYGKALPAPKRIPGKYPVYGSGGITGYHACAWNQSPSVIVGRKGTVGSLYWEDRPCFPIDTVFYVVSKGIPLTFCFYLLNSLNLEQMNTDAAVPGLNRNNVYRLAGPWSARDLITHFDATVRSLRERIFTAHEDSRVLTTTRDLLLPKLMSGELRVRDAERAVEAVL